MAKELLLSGRDAGGLVLDPRTKLALLIVMTAFILGGSYQSALHYVLAAVPLVLLLLARRWRASALYMLAFGGSLCAERFVLPLVSGVPGYLVVAIVGILLHFGPCIVMGYFVVTTTTVSEFVAAMERMRVPRQITIPLAVMFRFFPTVMEEWGAIGDAMRMRGVHWGGGKAGSLLEYRIVPMMMCSVRIGEELSAASLTRGLGGPVRRTNICQIGFHAQDVALLLLCLCMFVSEVFSWLER